MGVKVRLSAAGLRHLGGDRKRYNADTIGKVVGYGQRKRGELIRVQREGRTGPDTYAADFWEIV